MRRGVSLLSLALLVAALAATAARADSGAPTTTAATTTGTTTTTPAPTYTPLASSSLPESCLGAGTASITEPGRATLALGTPAAALGPSDYPDARPLLTFDSSTATGSRCRSESVTLDDVSLFGGAVTAASIAAVNGKGAVTGLEIAGASAALTAGQSATLGSWGLLTVDAKVGRLSAPLAIRLLEPHDSLPKGTRILVAFAALRQPVAEPPKASTTPAQTTGSTAQRTATRRKHQQKSSVPQPLKQTPRLGLKARSYVFPVDGGASYVDTYGAGRSDIYDGWHHGDDLFAPLGTPVLAVANGKLSLVGWNALGGWRVWLTDAKGNSFYYAHLSGYSRWILHHRRVKAGQVIGFLGRTGDAFTTTPHLHFEVHPHQLLSLGYDGAVDPTTYLHAWRVETVPAAEIPLVARLRAPSGTPTQEAAVVWRQLLKARHLLANGEPAVAFASAVRRPSPASQEIAADSVSNARRIAAVRTAAEVAARQGDGPWPLVALALALAASVLCAAFGVRRRRSRAAA